MERRQRVRAIWGLAGAVLAVAAIVVPLLVLAGSGQATLTAEAYADVIRFGVQDAATMQIQIYDLSERELWDSGVISSEFVDWDRTDTWGERLANGYYLYLVQAWDAREDLVLSKTGKVALLPGDKVQLQQAPSSIPQQTAISGDVPTALQPKATYNESLYLNDGWIVYQATGASQYVQGLSGVGGYQFMSLNPGRYFYFVSPSGSGKAALSFDTGSLGLGRTDTAAQLDISNSASQPALRIESSAGTSLIEAYNTGSGPATGLVFRVERASGNVGIGTANPTAKLSVAGVIESTTGGVKFPDGTTQTTAVPGEPCWSVTGNSGTNPTTNFLGTTDNIAFEVKVNGVRALRIEPNATSPNVIGGYSGNSVSAGIYGATVGGGGVSGSVNQVSDNYGTVGGGMATPLAAGAR